MGNAFDDFEFDETVRHQAQGPACVPCRRFRTGKLGNARSNLTGDFDLTSRSGAGLALKGIEWSNLATALTQALEAAYAKSGDLSDFPVLERGAMRSFVTKKQRYGRYGNGGLAALRVAESLELITLDF
jgi:hypothetical protein